MMKKFLMLTATKCSKKILEATKNIKNIIYKQEKFWNGKKNNLKQLICSFILKTVKIAFYYQKK